MNDFIPTAAIDLFCGCGGISEGLSMNGFDIRAGMDIEPKYISSFVRNFPHAKAIRDSVTTLSPQDFCKAIGVEPEEIGILVGGPPCQGFSKNVPRKFRYLDDPKNSLVKSFLDYAIFLNPPLLLMENVAEMRNGFAGHYTDEIMDKLGTAGYEVEHVVLNAADFGVPQRRRRAFFFANRLGIHLRPPTPTHTSSEGACPDLFNDLSPHINVWDAIGDLPSLNHGEGTELTEYETSAFSNYQAHVRNREGGVLNHVARRLQPLQFERLASLQPGQGLKDLPTHLKTKGGYSGAYGRLTKDMIAPTITRWVFHPGSGRWGHPVDIRVLSIREVARIQGFPDSFEFVGTYNDQAGQLGNAVPPLLIDAIIKDFKQQLSDYNLSKSSRKSASCSNEMRLSTLGRENVLA